MFVTSSLREVTRRFAGTETLEGAGVRLRRMFGNGQVPLFDPFLLLDNFGSSNPEDYLAGFPWHPHRGIETVTYMLNGRVAHEDSLGNSGTIDAGDLQWMTAGSGIIHQEMPQRSDGRLTGFQLWVNLPSRQKMVEPAYRGLGAAEIPTVVTEDGTRVKVVAGTFQGVEGPARGISVDPTYLDVQLPANSSFELDTPAGYTAFAQTFEGTTRFGEERATPARPQETLLFGPGDRVRARSVDGPSRFLLVSGRPLGEPVAWYGPIVMNRPEELAEAALELRRGTFIRHRNPRVEE
jgi:redox-sensitive bicupin YhaK (pirin superfamily)